MKNDGTDDRWMFTKEHYFDMTNRVSLCGKTTKEFAENARCKVCEKALDSPAKRQRKLIKGMDNED
jgi:hypothetical protein